MVEVDGRLEPPWWQILVARVSAQEIPWPKDPVLRPGAAPVAPESMGKH